MSSDYQTTVYQIVEQHRTAARQHIHDSHRLAQLEAGLHEDGTRLRDLLSAAQILHEISARTRDSILGLGERMTCRIVAAALEEAGVPSMFVSLENVVETTWLDFCASEAPPADGTQGLDPTFYYAQLSHRLGHLLHTIPSTHVPVVPGYFGPMPGSILQHVGKGGGYTDLCAALCAVGLEAEELQIWKQVDGVFTADPTKVPSARLILQITPDEAAELTH